jgi:hypothetical protein
MSKYNEYMEYLGILNEDDNAAFLAVAQGVVDKSPLANKVHYTLSPDALDDEDEYEDTDESPYDDFYRKGYVMDGEKEFFEIFYDDELGFDGERASAEWAELVSNILDALDVEATSRYGSPVRMVDEY